MEWATIAALILKEGLPVAMQIAQWWSNNAKPTDAEWAALAAKGAQFARQRMALALVQNGVDPTSPEGKALLDLTPP